MLKKFQKLGPHYSIERFGVMFLVLLIGMSVLLSSIVVRKVSYDKNTMQGQAVYTQSFTFSRTDTEGSVREVYVSEDRRECMLLLRMKDLANIPVDANDYMVFLTGSDSNQLQESLKSKPKSMVYMFGTTGYIGVYLYSPEPFPNQIMMLTLRSMNNFTDDGQSVSSKKMDDASYARYDQCKIFFNPGGTRAVHGKFLDGTSIDPQVAYREMIVVPREKNLRSELRNNLSQMRQQIAIMDEYSSRLESQGMMKPDVPAQISMDEVIAVNPSDEKKTPLSWNKNESRWQDESGKLYSDDAVWLFLNTGSPVSGGYDFNWQDGSIENGYLEKLTGSKEIADWNSYLKEHSDAMKGSENNLELPTTWKYANGESFEMKDSAKDSDMTNIQANIDALTDAWTAYYDLKIAYETDSLHNLLTLERDVKNVSEKYTVNTCEKNPLVIY